MNRGEVWEVNLDPTIGAEINKTLPCVIVSRDSIGRLPLRIIGPLTNWRDEFTQAIWHVPVESNSANGLTKKSSADTFQVRSISEKRLVQRLGKLSSEVMKKIGESLTISLALD